MQSSTWQPADCKDIFSQSPSTTGMARRPNTSWQIPVHCSPPTVTTTDGDRCRDAGTTCQRCGRQTHPRKDCWHRHEICQNCVDMPVRMRCKTNRAQKSQSRKFGVPLFMTLSAMVIVMAPNTPRLRRVAKNLFCAARRVKIQQHLLNIETGQTSQKSSRTSRRLNIFKI